jgi:arabinofuranan 3-O-arabinosyltransferase
MMATGTEDLNKHIVGPRFNPATLACAGAGGLALAYPAYLYLMFRSHTWILGANGRPSVTDFLVFWLAGRSALRGAAGAAYDPRLLHAAEVAISGHQFTRHMSWHYPPLFLFVAASLALLPLVVAFVVWVASTLALYSFTIFRIAKSPMAVVLSCAAPAVFINAIGGQNGPLTAALLGAALLCLEERPILSGIFIGLLTYRPQLGILFPVVLIAGGYWRTFIVAGITALAGLLACWGAFGTETMQACLHFLPGASDALLVKGENGFYNFQTVYGLVRWAGLGSGAGIVIQAGITLWAAVVLAWFWRREAPFPLKAVALATASLIASPYLYIYDFAVLTVAFAFLYRHRPFDAVEIAGVTAANVLVGSFLFFPSPIGLLAVIIAFALIVRHLTGTQAEHVSQGDPAGVMVQAAGS